MKNLPENVVSKIKILRERGYSYKEIAKITRVSVGAVYKYARDVSVSQVGLKRLQDLQRASQHRFIEKFGRCKPVKIFRENITKEKARILGHCLFDGYVSKYVVSYTSASVELLEQFIEDIRKEYSIYPSFKKILGKKVPYYTTYICSKIVCDDIRRFIQNCDTRSKQMLTSEIMEENDEIITEIASAFWEDEGSITSQGNLIGEIKNELLRNQLLHLHQRLGIKFSPYYDRVYDCYGIYVKRKSDNMKMFHEKIGFRYGVITAGESAGRRKLDVFLNYYKEIGGPYGIQIKNYPSLFHNLT